MIVRKTFLNFLGNFNPSGTFAIVGGQAANNLNGGGSTNDVYIYRGQVEGWEYLPGILNDKRSDHVAIPVAARDFSCYT